MEILSDFITKDKELKLEVHDKKYRIMLSDLTDGITEDLASGSFYMRNGLSKVQKIYNQHKEALLDSIYGNRETVCIKELKLNCGKKLSLILNRNIYRIVLIEEVYYTGSYDKIKEVDLEKFYIYEDIENVMSKFLKYYNHLNF